nr:MAG TPA: LysW biosynthesis protein LysW [Caudoviricetes sp.]
MEKYIEREALLAHLRECKETSTGSGLTAAVITAIQSFVEGMPLADVAPVVHGRWAPSEENPGFLVCSACGDCYVVDEWADGKKWRYCPACGAKMDGKGEEA